MLASKLLMRGLGGMNGLATSNGLASAAQRAKHTLPDLPYDYNALEPVISAEIMQLHHAKHHATYVNNLNVAEDKLDEAIENKDITAMIGLHAALRFNGGGHINHAIFWRNLCPGGTSEPEHELKASIYRDFGSFEEFKQKMITATVAIQGSGWGWLGVETETGRLRITTTSNQDPLQATTGLVPLFGIDVWEHAYYLQYKNVRADYVKAIFKIANWRDVEARFPKMTSNALDLKE